MKIGFDTYILRYLGLPLLATALFCSCTDEIASETKPGGGSTAGGEKVTIHLQVPGSSNGKKATTTRAVGDDDTQIAQTESRVNDLYIMAFDANNEFLYYKEAQQKNDQGIWQADLKQGGGETFLFAANVKGSEGRGNVNLLTTIQGLPAQTTKADALQMLEVALTDDEVANGFKADGATADAHRPFTMYGQLTKGSANATGNQWTVQLHRIMGRIQIQFGVNAADGIPGFVPKEVYLYNTNSKARVFPENLTDTEAGKYTTTPSIPTGITPDKGPVKYDIPADKNELNGQIYLFETMQPTANPPAAGDDAKRTCLVIGGLYDGDTNLSYYRVDLKGSEKDPANPGKDITVYKHVLRNHTYNIVVKSVKARGLDTKEEAFDNPLDNVEANTIVWDNGEIGNIDFIGDKFLGLGALEYKVPKLGGTFTQAVAASNGLVWKAELLNEDGTGTPNWLTFTGGNATMTGTGDGNVSKISLDAQAFQGTTGERRAIMRLTAGALKLEAALIQDYNDALVIKVAKSAEPGTEITELEYENGGGKGEELTISLSPEITTLTWKIETDANTGMKFGQVTVNGTTSMLLEGNINVEANGTKNEVRWTGHALAVNVTTDFGDVPATLKLTGRTATGLTTEKSIKLKQVKLGVSLDQDLIFCGGGYTPEVIKVIGNMDWTMKISSAPEYWIQSVISGDTGGPATDFLNAPAISLQTYKRIMQNGYVKEEMTLTFTDRNNPNYSIEKKVTLRGVYLDLMSYSNYKFYPIKGCFTPGAGEPPLLDPDTGKPLHEFPLFDSAMLRGLNAELKKQNDPSCPVGNIASDCTFTDAIESGVWNWTPTLSLNTVGGSQSGTFYQKVKNCPCSENGCGGANGHAYETTPLSFETLTAGKGDATCDILVDFNNRTVQIKSLTFEGQTATPAGGQNWQLGTVYTFEEFWGADDNLTAPLRAYTTYQFPNGPVVNLYTRDLDPTLSLFNDMRDAGPLKRAVFQGYFRTVVW